MWLLELIRNDSIQKLFSLNNSSNLIFLNFLIFNEYFRDEILTRNKFLEEEAKRKADTQENNEQQKEVQQDDFYDFDTKEK